MKLKTYSRHTEVNWKVHRQTGNLCKFLRGFDGVTMEEYLKIQYRKISKEK
jgi:hypothetical protein